MSLRRQLLLVSLLTLVLPWAGCQFIRETESALREGQQRMLGGTAQAIADSLSQFPDEFRAAGAGDGFSPDQAYGHPLEREPLLDGYVDDWTLPDGASRTLRGKDGVIRFAFGTRRQNVYFFAEVRDDAVVYRAPAARERRRYADGIELVTGDAGAVTERFVFEAEAPGELQGRRASDGTPETRVRAWWQDIPSGYRLEARVPRQLLGRHLGLVVADTDDPSDAGIRSATYERGAPGRFVTVSPVLESVVNGYAQPDLRLIVTDTSGWRLAQAGGLSGALRDRDSGQRGSGWVRRAYGLLLEPGEEAAFAEPAPLGRERQPYVQAALAGTTASAWFRSAETGRAVVTVAQPVWSGNVQTGALILQQGTDAILSLTNAALGRLMNFTLIATLAAAVALLGYASWLSFRIRRLSAAAERALEKNAATLALPSAGAGDEIGDLSRSFTDVLRKLGSYNEYLRTLASKLSHELRTPLTIVSSSLDNLEHASLSPDAAEFTSRAREGVARLKKILNAMSEASRVEELIQNAEPEDFDLHAVLGTAVASYAGAWPRQRFRYDSRLDRAVARGSPELFMQMLDKLIDNAVGYTDEGGEIVVGLARRDGDWRVSVFNPGPPLPEKMRAQLFDSMVSVREGDSGEHLGLGLYVARLIAEGHGGSITAENTADGVAFHVRLPAARERDRGGDE